MTVWQFNTLNQGTGEHSLENNWRQFRQAWAQLLCLLLHLPEERTLSFEFRQQIASERLFGRAQRQARQIHLLHGAFLKDIIIPATFVITTQTKEETANGEMCFEDVFNVIQDTEARRILRLLVSSQHQA